MKGPFSIDGSTVRWVQISVSRLNPAIGATILSVMIGRGEMTKVKCRPPERP